MTGPSALVEEGGDALGAQGAAPKAHTAARFLRVGRERHRGGTLGTLSMVPRSRVRVTPAATAADHGRSSFRWSVIEEIRCLAPSRRYLGGQAAPAMDQ